MGCLPEAGGASERGGDDGLVESGGGMSVDERVGEGEAAMNRDCRS
jgi:hypothetical protein